MTLPFSASSVTVTNKLAKISPIRLGRLYLSRCTISRPKKISGQFNSIRCLLSLKFDTTEAVKPWASPPDVKTAMAFPWLPPFATNFPSLPTSYAILLLLSESVCTKACLLSSATLSFASSCSIFGIFAPWSTAADSFSVRSPTLREWMAKVRQLPRNSYAKTTENFRFQFHLNNWSR